MADIERRPGETVFDHHKRLVLDKIVNKTLGDVDYTELAKIVYGKELSSDDARKRMYGSAATLQLLDSTMSKNVANRILALSDFHVPFNLSIDTFRQYAGHIDTLVLNGDLEDCQSISRFTKMYRINLVDEMIMTRDLIIQLVTMIKPRHLYITVGNHEARMGRSLANALGPDVLEVMPDTPLDLILKDGFRRKDRMSHTETWYAPLIPMLEDKRIDVHFDGGWYCKVGRTIFAHPLTFSSGMLKTTEKAVNYFLRMDRDFNTIVLGHTHKIGSYIQGGISMFEQGCCCDLSQLDYADGKLLIPGQEGYLYICQDRDGNIIQDHTRLVQL